MEDSNGGEEYALADNLSVMLVPTTPMAPVPLNTELLENGDFEGPFLLGMTSPSGWHGQGGDFQRATYGTGSWPSTNVSSSIGGGTLCLNSIADGNFTVGMHHYP